MKWAPLGALCMVGCGADYETEHLRITTHFDAPLCAGNLDTYERVIESDAQQSAMAIASAVVASANGWRPVVTSNNTTPSE